MDYYQSAYKKQMQPSFNLNEDEDEAMQMAILKKQEASEIAPNAVSITQDAGMNTVRSGGNVPLAAGLTALDFIQKQQAAKIAQREALKNARMQSTITATDMLNRALDRQMQAWG
jgi:ATP-dependent protease HslVU (ClpYQ) peptidase subunit